MTSARVSGYPPSGLTPEEARNVRARVWRYVFDCHAKKKAAGGNGGEEHARKESKHVSRKRIISK